MISIDVIRPGSLFQIVGPVATLRRILLNRDYFTTHNLDITVYNGNREYKTLDDLTSNNSGSVYGSKHHVFEWLSHHAVESY